MSDAKYTLLLHIGRLRIFWGYRADRPRLLRGYAGWMLYIGRLIIGTMGG